MATDRGSGCCSDDHPSFLAMAPTSRLPRADRAGLSVVAPVHSTALDETTATQPQMQKMNEVDLSFMESAR